MRFELNSTQRMNLCVYIHTKKKRRKNWTWTNPSVSAHIFIDQYKFDRRHSISCQFYSTLSSQLTVIFVFYLHDQWVRLSCVLATAKSSFQSKMKSTSTRTTTKIEKLQTLRIDKQRVIKWGGERVRWKSAIYTANDVSISPWKFQWIIKRMHARKTSFTLAFCRTPFTQYIHTVYLLTKRWRQLITANFVTTLNHLSIYIFHSMSSVDFFLCLVSSLFWTVFL